MGVYDTIYGHCPACGRAYESQTKLGASELAIWRVGSEVSLADSSYALKTVCECGVRPVAVVKGGMLIALQVGGETVRELPFGDYEVVESSDATSQTA